VVDCGVKGWVEPGFLIVASTSSAEPLDINPAGTNFTADRASFFSSSYLSTHWFRCLRRSTVSWQAEPDVVLNLPIPGYKVGEHMNSRSA